MIYIKNFYLIAMFMIAVILQSCTREPFQDEKYGSKGAININLNTRALKEGKVRIIVCHNTTKQIIINSTDLTDNSSTDGNSSFVVSIFPGNYSFYAIVNELDNLTAELDAIKSEKDLNSMKIQPENPFTEETVMLLKKKDVVIAVDSDGKTTVDGALKPLEIELERAYAKISLKINKATTNPADKFTIKQVDFLHSPTYSYLNAKVYDGTTYVSREMFKGSLEFTTNGDKEEIVKEIPTGTKPSNIFAEYRLADADKSTHDKASYLGIQATYTPAGGTASFDVYYKIPVGDYKGTNAVDGAGHDYNIHRNHHYAINAKITKMGEKDAVEITYVVTPWGNEKMDVEIEGDPFLDVSNVEVDVYDAAATRIYFYSNMPKVEIDAMLLNGTQSIPVSEVFDSIVGVNPTNFKYTYDVPNQRGEGYFDLININTDNSVRQQRKLYLKSGTLVREITATTRISAEAAKANTQPFVGTFHRYMERGERIVSWHLPSTTKWKAEIVTDEPLLAAYAEFLRIDHLASPNHAKLYTLEPPSAEGAFVLEEMVGGVKTPILKIEGRGRVYFRVGWSEVLKSETAHRFAKIKVTTSTDNFVVGDNTKVSYLYCRQGEEPKAIVSNSTIFASYNISTPETFVDFPTQSGYLYQWNRTTPWAVTGTTVNNYPKGDETNVAANNGYEYKTYSNESYICPAKYSYPDNQALTVMNTALDPDRVMYQWGYYADGFFDRRAVSDHIVRNAVGEIASAGGLFCHGGTAVAIFLPTVSWRDYQGIINNLPPHQEMGVIGHYWSWAQDGEWSKTTTNLPKLPRTLGAMALHLTRNPKPDSYLESLNKASAASVRCMRLEGKTVSFDANGGLTTPRSMTVKDGEITFPSGPKNSNPLLEFVDWASARGGSTTTYKAGASVAISLVGDKTWYAQYKKLTGYTVNGNLLELSLPSGLSLNYTSSDLYCKALNIGGVTGWRLPTYDEAVGLFSLVSNLFLYAGTELWTSSEVSANDYYTLYKELATYTTKTRNYNFSSNTFARCVRELN